MDMQMLKQEDTMQHESRHLCSVSVSMFLAGSSGSRVKLAFFVSKRKRIKLVCISRG